MYRELQYFVAMPGKKVVGEDGKRQRLQLLKPLSGSAVPGQLTALMGGSGAGKVTRGPDEFFVQPLPRLYIFYPSLTQNPKSTIAFHVKMNYYKGPFPTT